MLLSCLCQLWIQILAAAQTRVEILRRSFPLPILPESKGLDVGIVETKQVGSYSHVFSGIPQNPLFRYVHISNFMPKMFFFTYTFHIEKPPNSPPLKNPLKHHGNFRFHWDFFMHLSHGVSTWGAKVGCQRASSKSSMKKFRASLHTCLIQCVLWSCSGIVRTPWTFDNILEASNYTFMVWTWLLKCDGF